MHFQQGFHWVLAKKTPSRHAFRSLRKLYRKNVFIYALCHEVLMCFSFFSIEMALRYSINKQVNLPKFCICLLSYLFTHHHILYSLSFGFLFLSSLWLGVLTAYFYPEKCLALSKIFTVSKREIFYHCWVYVDGLLVKVFSGTETTCI